MHHLSHLTNDYVNLLKGRAPSSTLKVPFHTFSSVCYYNTPEDGGELRGEVHSSFCPALLCSHFSSLQKESGVFWVQVRFMQDESTETVEEAHMGTWLI